MRAVSLGEALLDPRLPVGEMIPVKLATVPPRLRRMVEVGAPLASYWQEAWGPMPGDREAPGCTFGCKVFVRAWGDGVRYAVFHSLTYGHSHSPHSR